MAEMLRPGDEQRIGKGDSGFAVALGSSQAITIFNAQWEHKFSIKNDIYLQIRFL
ncbi:MAG: hypothetical protein ACUVQG_02795 [Thermogutta sp.]